MKLLEGIDKKNSQQSVEKLKTALQKMRKMGIALQQKLGEKIVQLMWMLIFFEGVGANCVNYKL